MASRMGYSAMQKKLTSHSYLNTFKSQRNVKFSLISRKNLINRNYTTSSSPTTDLPPEAYTDPDFLDFEKLDREVVFLSVKKMTKILQENAAADVPVSEAYLETLAEEHPEISMFSIAEAIGKVRKGEDPELIADSLLNPHGVLERPEVPLEGEYQQVSEEEMEEIDTENRDRLRHLRNDQDYSEYRSGFINLTHWELFNQDPPQNILPASFPVGREIDSLYGSSSAVRPEEQHFIDLTKDKEKIQAIYESPMDMIPEPFRKALVPLGRLFEQHISQGTVERSEEEVSEDQYAKDIRGDIVMDMLRNDPRFSDQVDISRGGGRLLGTRREETLRLSREIEDLNRKQRAVWQGFIEAVHEEAETQKVGADASEIEALNHLQTHFNSFKQSLNSIDRLGEQIESLYNRLYFDLDRQVSMEDVDVIERQATELELPYLKHVDMPFHHALVEQLRDRVNEILHQKRTDPDQRQYFDVEEMDEFDFTRPPTYEELKAVWQYYNHLLRKKELEKETSDGSIELFGGSFVQAPSIDPDLIEDSMTRDAAQWAVAEAKAHPVDLLGLDTEEGENEPNTGDENIQWEVTLPDAHRNRDTLLNILLAEGTGDPLLSDTTVSSLEPALLASPAAKEVSMTRIEGDTSRRFVERCLRRLESSELSVDQRKQIIAEVVERCETPEIARRLLAELIYGSIISMPPAQRRGPLEGLRHEFSVIGEEINQAHAFYQELEQTLVSKASGEQAATLLKETEFPVMHLETVVKKYVKHMESSKNEEHDSGSSVGETIGNVLSPVLMENPKLNLENTFTDGVPTDVWNAIGSNILSTLIGHPGKYMASELRFTPGLLDARGLFHPGMYDSENDGFLGGNFHFDLATHQFLASDDTWGRPDATTISGKRMSGYNMRRLGSANPSLLKKVDWAVGPDYNAEEEYEEDLGPIDTDFDRQRWEEETGAEEKEPEMPDQYEDEEEGSWRPRKDQEEQETQLKPGFDRHAYFRKHFEEYQFHDDPLVGADNEYAHIHMPTHDPREVIPAYLRRFYIITTPDYHAYFREGMPGRLDMVFAMLHQRGLMLREPTMKAIQQLRRFDRTVRAALDGQQTDGMYNPRGFMFTGDRGTGKSTSLAMAMHWARRSGYMVVTVRSAYQWTHGMEGVVHPSPVLNSEYYDNPVLSMSFLKDFKKSNFEFIENRPMKNKLQPSDDDPNIDTILDLVNWGINDPTATTIATKFLLDELALIDDIPIAIAVDDYNFFNDMTNFYYGNLLKFKEVEPRRIHANELTLVRGLNKILLENKPNTLWLTALTAKHRTPNNWDERESVFERFTHHNYTIEELTNIFTYYLSVYCLDTYSTAQFVKEMHFMTAGNPEKVFEEVRISPNPSDTNPLLSPQEPFE